MGTLKSWEDTYKYWVTANVPDVELISFDIKKHSPYFEWYNKKEKSQLHYHDKPVKQTAFHLGKYLKDKDPELITSYKIFSVLKYLDLYEYIGNIEAGFSKFNENLYGWWSPNAKHLFPYFENINNSNFSKRKHRNADWKIIVDIIAEFWTELEKSLAIVIIPELMDHDSSEYKAYNNFEESIEEQRQYQQYLRLKEKFEKK
jgi:hypothetical protein